MENHRKLSLDKHWLLAIGFWLPTANGQLPMLIDKYKKR